MDQEEGNGATLSRDAEQSRDKSSKAPVLLSITQLVLRRGFFLLVLLVLFIASVAVHVVFPVPQPLIMPKTNGTLTQDYNFTSSPVTLMEFPLNP